jgi:hypothetical protein
MKKPPKFPKAKTVAQSDDRSWHNGGDIEIGLYARSLHRAGKNLIATLDLQPSPKTAWDACPVILLYREAIELHLKALVDNGSKFLPSTPDPLSLAKTHSLRWLAQIVCQIIKAVEWENIFKYESVSSLADFSRLLSELEALDPVGIAVQFSNHRSDGSVPTQLQPPNIVQFARRLDGVLDLLDATADALAAMVDQMESFGEDNFHAKPTIH